MKKLNKKLQELITIYESGKLEDFIESLSISQIGNYLHLIEIKKRAIISDSFRKIFQLNEIYREIESTNRSEQDSSFYLKLNWFNNDLRNIKKHRQTHLKNWEKIERLIKQKQKEYKLNRAKRIAKNNI